MPAAPAPMTVPVDPCRSGASVDPESTRIRLDGPRTQGGLLQGRVAPGSGVEFEGRPVRVSEDGWFLVGFGRDAPPEAEVVVSAPGGGRERLVLAVAPREYRIERIDGLPGAKVAPRDEEALARIEREAGRVAEARTPRRPEGPISGAASGGRSPAASAASTARSGSSTASRASRTTGSTSRPPAGTKVRAPADGLVTLAEPDLFLSGGTLIVDHGQRAVLGLPAPLAHSGEAGGSGSGAAGPSRRVGATGRATGPHLDWRVSLFDRRLDPALLVGPMPT